MATYQCTVSNPRSRWVTEVREEHADLESNKIRWWCRCKNCCASLSAENSLTRHYQEWHPGVNHKPLDASTYANSRHILGSAYVPGCAPDIRRSINHLRKERENQSLEERAERRAATREAAHEKAAAREAAARELEAAAHPRPGSGLRPLAEAEPRKAAACPQQRSSLHSSARAPVQVATLAAERFSTQAQKGKGKEEETQDINTTCHQYLEMIEREGLIPRWRE
jgi:hypothetical protein